MITNKDIRVDNGFLIINGDKFPLDGQSPETIMQIVEDNSDTTPTENSTAPITSGGLYNTIGDLTQTGVSGASVAAQLKTLVTTVRNATGDIAITRVGAVRVITFNRVAYSDAQAFYTALDSSDKTTQIQMNTVMRTSSDNKYMTLGFVYASAAGGLTVKHFAGYNADGIEGQIGSSDLIIGELVYTV